MNKIGFLLSGLLALTGLHLGVACVWAEKLYPKIGYLIFKSKPNGSYRPSDYVLDLSSLFGFGILLCIAGVVLGGWFYSRRAADHRFSQT